MPIDRPITGSRFLPPEAIPHIASAAHVDGTIAPQPSPPATFKRVAAQHVPAVRQAGAD